MIVQRILDLPRRCLALGTGLAWLAAFAPAIGFAQSISVYAPIQDQYSLGGFAYEAPKTDGWRQVASDGNTLMLVYAETTGDEQINTRTQIEMQAFSAPPGAITGDVLWLTEQGHAQQVKERGDALVEFSKISPVSGGGDIMRYSLTSKIGGTEQLIEVFYVALAGDKSEYLVAKLSTKESDYATQPYVTAYEASLATLRHGEGKPADEAPGGSAATP